MVVCAIHKVPEYIRVRQRFVRKAGVDGNMDGNMEDACREGGSDSVGKLGEFLLGTDGVCIMQRFEII